MKRIWLGALAATALVACSGENAFLDDGEEEEEVTEPDTGTGIDSDREVPPGTASPTPATGIFRTEPTEAQGGQVGDGFVTDVAYNSADDTFTVDNLGFDGDNVYDRGTLVSSFGDYAVYEAATQFPDSVTGSPINQFTHRAIYGVSNSGSVEFAIVRTGAYVNYGFGGFVYQRNDGVNLPTTGQALYSGETAGIRDFDGSGGIQYSTGDIDVAIDFDDFNDTTGSRGDAVRGVVYNREVYDINGTDITQTIVDGINADTNSNLDAIPTLTFEVGPGVMDNNGEIVGNVNSFYVNADGEVATYETGNYYAIVSGDNAEEIVGVIVTTTDVGGPAGATTRDTSGFIVYRE